MSDDDVGAVYRITYSATAESPNSAAASLLSAGLAVVLAAAVLAT